MDLPKLKEKIKKSLFILWISILVFSLINITIFYIGNEYVDQPYKISNQSVAIVLGTKDTKKNKASQMLKDRLDAVAKLYDLNKVHKIFVTGDNRPKIKEVDIMKGYLVSKGIPNEALILDKASFTTYESFYRAKKVFGIKKAVIVSQQFHLSRAIFISKSLGMDVEGLIADKQTYGLASVILTFREYPANIKALLQIVLRFKPKYLKRQVNP